ncbi:MAG: MMPL/RND family transporter, partial [Thermoplasmata archaeon]
MESIRPRRSTRGERLFGSLGRFIVRHPWYPIIFWIVLLLVAAPFLSRVGSVTTNSTANVPASAPSSIAQAKIAALFPNQTAGSDSIVLVTGSDLLAAPAQQAVLAVTGKIAGDPNLTEVSGLQTLYSAYASYLLGQARLGLGVLNDGLSSSPSLLTSVNGTVGLIWGPPTLFLAAWEAYGAAHPGTAPATWNAPADRQAEANLSGNPPALAVLEAFYQGANGSAAGFNGSADCAADAATVVACTDATVRTNVGPLLPGLVPASGLPIAAAVLSGLGEANATSYASVQATVGGLLGASSGLPGPFLTLLWQQFPTLAPALPLLTGWTVSVADGPVAAYPLPIPAPLESGFLAPDGTAELLLITYAVSDSYTVAGSSPVFADVQELGRIIPPTLAAADPGGDLKYYQTGGAPLDLEENTVLSSSLALVLPLTILVLIGITIAYFRAPLAPLLTFGGLGIALGLGIGAVVLIGSLVTKVDVTSIELEETFVLGVGTDYSIFLVSRYREELYGGAAPTEAVVTAVTWAGQSVATSGGTAVISTLALAFSGVALLSEWGMVLSVAILLTVLISLTLVPAFLVLLGRRVFWPAVGARFDRQAERARRVTRTEASYFFRTGRRTQHRPKTILFVILLVSLPILYVASNVPISYNFYQQLPGGLSATDGLAELNSHFGPGFAFPIQALVSFPSPLVVGNMSNATEFEALAGLTALYATTPQVQSVGSPVGPQGAPLGEWLNLSRLPGASRTSLQGLLAGFVGTDGRSVLLTVTPAVGGLSYAAVQLLGHLRSEFDGYQATHPALTSLYFGGGAPVTRDLAAQTSLATTRMIALVALGLMIVLFVVLRSWLIPLLAVATIGLSLAWSWGISDIVLRQTFGIPIFFFVPTILFIIILGLGIDYNIFLLTRVREERLKGRDSSTAVVRSVGLTGGIITAAAVILASAFAVLALGQFLLLRSIGFAVAVAILLDAMVVRTYLVPSALQALGARVWELYPFQRGGAPGIGAGGRGPD